MISFATPVASSDSLVSRLVADMVSAPFNAPLFTVQDRISECFTEALRSNPEKVREAFLVLRGKIATQLHCPDLEKKVADEEDQDPSQKVARLAHVVDRINEVFRKELLIDLHLERGVSPFEELEAYLNPSLRLTKTIF